MRKMQRKAPALSQYEPLITPDGWSGEERHFALGVTKLMDQLFQKQASLHARIAALEKQQEKEENHG